MNSSNDNDLSDTVSLLDMDASSDFEIVDYESESEARSFAPSSAASATSEVASTASDAADSPLPSPRLEASQFHFPDPASVFEDVNVDSCSLHTLMATSQQQSHEPSVLQNESNSRDLEAAHPQQSTIIDSIIDFNNDFKLHMTDDLQEERPATSFKRMVIEAPKTAWLVLLLTTVLIGFKSSSYLHNGQQASSSLATLNVDSKWITKFAAPASTPYPAFHHLRPIDPIPQASSSKALAPKPSPSSLSVVDREPSTQATQQKQTSSKQKHVEVSSKEVPVALQPVTNSAKSLTLAAPLSVKSIVRQYPYRVSSVSKLKRKAPFPSRWTMQTSPDMPVFPIKVDSFYLDNATTTTWAFWLAELNNYHQLVLRPALMAAREQVTAAREQAKEAARVARRYHQEQIQPALASLREQAVYTAHRTAEFTAQYKDERLRPAYAFVREQAGQTAQRTTEYREKVLKPAVAQFRQQAMEAAMTTSKGIDKAAKRFSSDAAVTVQQVKEATNLNLEAIGIDDYVGFMLGSFKSMKHNLRASVNAQEPAK